MRWTAPIGTTVRGPGGKKIWATATEVDGATVLQVPAPVWALEAIRLQVIERVAAEIPLDQQLVCPMRCGLVVRATEANHQALAFHLDDCDGPASTSGT